MADDTNFKKRARAVQKQLKGMGIKASFETQEVEPLDQFLKDAAELPFPVHFFTREDYERKFYCENYTRLRKQAEEKALKEKK